MGLTEKIYVYVLIAIFVDSIIQTITGLVIDGGFSVTQLFVGIINISTGTNINFGATNLLFLVFWVGVLLVVLDLQKGRAIKT
jgi:hypothetical protein